MSGSAPVAVTGMAWTTPLGDNLEAVWDQLIAGKSGLRPLAHAGRLRNDLAASVTDPDPTLPAGSRMRTLAIRTVSRALDAVGLDARSAELALVVGTSLGAYLEDEAKAPSLYSWVEDVGKELGLARPPIAVSTACSSGSDAILVGAELIRSGAARYCVCGGVDVLTWSKRLAHSTLGTMSPTTLRAFDTRHDGTILGEGAGFVVLEAPGSSRPALAILRGAGSGNDATGMTAPEASGLGARYAMERSLSDGGLTAGDIGLINAHGSGTLLNDATEQTVFAAMFPGSNRPLVFATKGNFGHSLGATGTLEAIALILALRTGQVPPVVGLEQPIPEFPLPLAYPERIDHRTRFGLSLTLGFGGFDTSLIFEGIP